MLALRTGTASGFWEGGAVSGGAVSVCGLSSSVVVFRGGDGGGSSGGSGSSDSGLAGREGAGSSGVSASLPVKNRSKSAANKRSTTMYNEFLERGGIEPVNQSLLYMPN